MNQSPTWHDVIGEEKKQSYFVDTLNFVESERSAEKRFIRQAKMCLMRFAIPSLTMLRW